MAKLSTLKKRVRPFRVDIDGEVIIGKFYPGVYTPRFEEDLNSIDESSPDANRVVARKLCALVAEWDLTNDDESLLPISEETLCDVSYDVQMAIMVEIGKNIVPNPKASVSTGSF